MDFSVYKNRIVDKTIHLYLQTFGAVCVEGPKWCGKTWSSIVHSKSSYLIADPTGDFNNKKLAQIDNNVVLTGEFPRLIDEWQEVPSLWDAVRSKVDMLNIKGAYILTGSATINRDSYIHSGAGRIGRIRMKPMSLFESGFSSGVISLESLCNGDFQSKSTGEVKLQEIIKYIVVGGWPGSLGLSIEQAMVIPKEYVKAVLNDDIFRVDNVKRNSHKINLLLRSLARNESTTVSNAVLRKDINDVNGENIDIDTISDYLSILDKLFLTDNTKPYSNNMRSSIRVKQAEKRHLCDPSLVAALLNATPDSLLNDLETLGFLFESLVERDLSIYAQSFDASLYHYRDYNNNEIDSVIELKDGSWCGFEIKLGANQIEKAAQNLIRINEQIIDKGGKGAKILCVICGLSNAAYKRPDGVYVIPITALKN